MPHPIAYLATGLFVVGCLMACRGNATEPTVPTNPTGNPGTQTNVPATPTPASATFTPTRGATFSVVLPGTPGGYTWSLAAGADVKVAKPKGEKRSGPAPSGGLLGPVADEIFDFTAEGVGTTTLTFVSARSWETPDKAVETRRYTVTVR